ncbi:hypothetical protein Fcan01_24357 [Folsomia candida]|uniref:Uncharacterized protein n=1 Tax=Folsomia candida TaxID=158441 RepID=A0A226D9H6_FOLCA|nr:hypothetical protein Fcan01_24357 [Folsomia candida]
MWCTNLRALTIFHLSQSQRNAVVRKVLIFMNIMCPGIGVIRMRRLFADSCNPPYLGFLLGYCSSCGEQLISGETLRFKLMKSLLVVLDGYHCSVFAFKAFFLIFNVTIVSVGCILDYLDILKRISGVASNVGLTTRIGLYRCLQVLEKQLNNTLSTRVIPTVMIIAPIIQIFCSVVLIKYSSFLPSKGFVTYPFTTCVCFTSCMVFETFAAQLGVQSVKQYHSWLTEKRLT